MTDRIEFPESVKSVVAKRAGFRCSVPDCQAPTIGPGRSADDFVLAGEASHIFSAAKNGPRGRGELSAAQLRSSKNCIWLCRKHARLVDVHRGRDYPANLLLSYKAQHEFATARALGTHPCPFGWVEAVRFHSSSHFESNAEVRFAKATLVVGNAGAGKTAMAACVASALSPDSAEHWLPTVLSRGCHEFSVTYRTPEVRQIDVAVRDGNIRYSANGEELPFNPFQFCVVALHQSPHPAPEQHLWVSGLNQGATLRALSQLEIEFHGTVRSFALGSDHALRIDIDRGCVPLQELSAGEQRLVLVRLASALADFSSRYRPTLLLLDSLHPLDAVNRRQCLDDLCGEHHGYQTLVLEASGLETASWGGWQQVWLTHANQAVHVEHHLGPA